MPFKVNCLYEMKDRVYMRVYTNNNPEGQANLLLQGRWLQKGTLRGKYIVWFCFIFSADLVMTSNVRRVILKGGTQWSLTFFFVLLFTLFKLSLHHYLFVWGRGLWTSAKELNEQFSRNMNILSLSSINSLGEVKGKWQHVTLCWGWLQNTHF